METVTCSSWTLILAVTTFIVTANSLPLGQFVSFGAEDMILPKGSSDAAQRIAISSSFPFFGRTYDSINVSSIE